MGFRISKLPTGTAALGTYTRDATSYLYTYRYGAPLVSGTKDLTVRVYVGTGWDASVPRPAVVLMRLGGFTITGSIDNTDAQQWADVLVSAGIAFAIADCRVYGDNPSSPDDAALGITGDQYARSVNASIDDCVTLYQWIKGVRALDTWAVEPNWVFPAGNSAGAMAILCAMQKYPWYRAMLPGVIMSAAAYGYDAGPSFDTALRTTLGYTEAGHTSAFPPICAYQGGADPVLGSRQATFKTLLDGLGNGGTTHYDPAGVHTSAPNFNTAALTGATTVQEAMKDFIDVRTAAIARSRSCVTFG